jgi:Na+/melibiose symporter-like transporter
LLISQIGISIGQPFVLNGITKLATSWFSPKEEATAVGLGSLSLFVGMMIALGATPWLVEGFGFSAMIWIYGIMGIVGMLAFLFFTREMPPTPARASETLEELTSWGSIKHILKMRDFVILGFVALVGIGVFNGLATWLEKILNEVHNMPMTDAGNISAALILSGMIGCFVIPLISDKIGRRKPFLILASLVGALAVTAFIFAKSYGLNMLNGVLIGFFLISALPIMLTMSAEITGLRYAGVSVGYLQLLGNAAAVVLVAAMESLRGSTGVLLSSENVPLIVQ